MPAPDRIKQLVDQFDQYTANRFPTDFDEASLRMSFIDPFWEELGWNVRDPREVVVEKRVAIRASTKFADYCMLISDKPRLIIESKDPRKKVDDPDFIFQVKRYGYNLPVDFAVLTNFGEFRLYDTGLEPVFENTARGLIRDYSLSFHDYVEHWDKLASVFSRQAVADNVLQTLLPRERRTHNKEALDRKFFENLSEWRTELAGNIALRNKDLKVHEINEAVQRIIDRIIFIRVIEDRGIEATELLQGALDKWKREKEKPLYRYFVDIFRKLKPQYNGQLFENHFSEDLFVDEALLKRITEQLYYPKCPYQFNLVGVEMLGTIYERFLGSTIRLTPTHRAVVEEKPEVRKAGGVYYTPKYIVDYIVENTVGRLLEACKTPADVAKLCILDPACGSGSFLLGAFQKLIDWHEAYFNANPKKIRKGSAECWWDKELQVWKLTPQMRGEILRNNIYGVDIDAQAVEVTIMSLYLRVLEDVEAWSLVKSHLLPDMDRNIRCGNSLIGEDYWDFVSGKQESLFRSEDEERRVNTFDWQRAFPEVFAAGGFDAVIGNPPYQNMIVLDEFLPNEGKLYLKSKYVTATGGFDIYIIFIEQGINMVKIDGRLSFIIPNKFLAAEYAISFRRWLIQNVVFESLIDFSRCKVFEASVYPVIISLINSKPNNRIKLEIKTGHLVFDTSEVRDTALIDLAELKEMPDYIWSFVTEPGLVVFKKILENSIPLGDKSIAEVCGSATVSEAGNYVNCIVEGKPQGGMDAVKLVITGSIDRYSINWDIKPITFSHVKYSKPYLILNKSIPDRRIHQAKSEKLLIAKVALRPEVFWDTEGIAGIFVAYVFSKSYSLGFLSGILNSKLIAWVYKMLFGALSMSKGYMRFQPPQLKRVPIVKLDITAPEDLVKHNRMVEMVMEMLDLHKRLVVAKADNDKTRLEERIKRLDAQIDALVYELYGLTDEEIKIVEGEK